MKRGLFKSVPMWNGLPLVLLLALTPCYEAVASLLHRRPGGVQLAKADADAGPVHMVLAKGGARATLSAGAAANASSDLGAGSSGAVNASSAGNSTMHFNVLSHGPALGKVFVLYYSTMSGEKVSEMVARGYKTLADAPSDPPVFSPETGSPLARGSCPLRLTSANYATDHRKYNLRMAEVAVCAAFYGQPCGGAAKGCEVEIMAPLPSNSDQEPYVGAGIALVAHSLLCSQHVEAWQVDSCELVRKQAVVAAGLQNVNGAIRLRPIPSAWMDLKMDATYELAFQEVVFASANEAHYHESENYRRKHDVLAWSRAPPTAVFCSDLSCLVSKFERR
mmetsp:Transcript_18805/g.48810  ORF Transcript_18805/g.48810 Transcript_18805/m.48810 type:complete len:335 (-) Transcript_18805:45-1049(-)